MRRTGAFALLTLAVGLVPLALTGCNREEDPFTAQVEVEVVRPGTGHKLESGDFVWVNYVGKLPNGTEFDSNRNLNEGMPFPVVIGTTQVIPGWHRGLEGLQEGGKYILNIPAVLAYGKEGKAPAIPPNTNLIFEMEIVKTLAKSEFDLIKTKTIREGTGPTVENGDRIEVHYTAKYINGRQFDDSRKRSATGDIFQVGAREVVPGIDLAVVGMKQGGIREITIPPYMAWGRGGTEGVLPDQITIYTLEVVRVEKFKAPQ